MKLSQSEIYGLICAGLCLISAVVGYRVGHARGAKESEKEFNAALANSELVDASLVLLALNQLRAENRVRAIDILEGQMLMGISTYNDLAENGSSSEVQQKAARVAGEIEAYCTKYTVFERHKGLLSHEAGKRALKKILKN